MRKLFNYLGKHKLAVLDLFLGTLILSVAALYNGYPLVYSDTGTYIYSGFDKFIPADRPISYGLFIYYVSMQFSLWFVVFVQNLIVAFLLREVTIFVLGNGKHRFWYHFIVVFLSLFTGVSWYTSQIMPDFFAPVTILSVFLILKNIKANVIKTVIYGLILVLSMIVHFSHLLIAIVTVTLFVGMSWVLVKKKFFENNSMSFKRLIYIFGVIIVAWFTLPTINYAIERKFILSKGSHAFLMAHLVDTGILEDFLKEHCDSEEYKHWKLCAYKDSLPDNLADFLWQENGVFKKTGYWENSKEEYTEVIKSTLVHERYLAFNLYKSLNYGTVLLFRNEIGNGLSAYGEGSPPYGQVHWRFHHELNNYLNARQNKWNGVNLNFDDLNKVNLYVNIASLFLLILIFFTDLLYRIKKSSVQLLIYFLIGVVSNAYITAGLNSPVNRFQARVVWLIPFVLFLVLMNNRIIIAKFFKEKINSFLDQAGNSQQH